MLLCDVNLHRLIASILVIYTTFTQAHFCLNWHGLAWISPKIEAQSSHKFIELNSAREF